MWMVASGGGEGTEGVNLQALLDSIIGDRLPISQTPLECLAREATEEASFDAG